MSDLRKRGLVKRTVKYTKDGEEKNTYVHVGDYFSTDGGNRQAIKLLATATSDEVWLNIYPLEDQKPVNSDDYADPNTRDQDVTRAITQHEVLNKAKDVILEEIDDKPIDLSTIPF